MRRSHWIFIFSFATLFALPHLTHAATNVFTSVFPASCNCLGTAPDFGCILQVFQNLMNDLVALATILITLFIGYGGFTYIMSPANPEKRKQANARIVNAVIGLLVVLSAWLLVDSLMKVIYNPSVTAPGQTSQLGPWNKILFPDGTPATANCIIRQVTPTGVPSAAGTSAANTTNAAGATVASSPSQNAVGSCTASAFAGVFGSNASKMSCVTKYEDASCNPSAPSGTDKGSDGNVVSFGLFQINISANNLSQYPACEAVVGNQPLNCTQAFSGGVYTSSNHATRVSNASLYNVCKQAVTNADCNAAAANDILGKQGIGAWGSAAQSNCS